MVVDTTLYDLLGVDSEASDADIKKAYRKSSLANHPDKNPGDEEASARFQEISAAYETLSDPDSRAAYDRYGPESAGGGPGGMAAGADMDDILAQMFGMGGMGGMGGGPRRKPKCGQDSIIDYDVTLKDLYLGRTTHFNISKQVICPACEGSGGKPGTKVKQCFKCQGKGRCLQMRSMGNGMVAQSYSTCDECDGEGEKVRDKDRCKKCKGGKTVKGKSKLELRIERGMQDGQTIVFKGENDQEPGVPEPGAIIFRLALKEDPAFKLKGLDLLVEVHLTLREALMGFNRTVLVHLDGRHIKVEKPAGTVTKPNSVDRIEGEGMPQERDIGERGDLYIQWHVDFPEDGWLSGRTEAERALSSVLPPPRPAIPAEEDTEVTDAQVQRGGASMADFGKKQPRSRPQDEDEFWQDETEAPSGGCASG